MLSGRKKARDREDCYLLENDEALTATNNMDSELASKMNLALYKLAKLDKLEIKESQLDSVITSIASIEETIWSRQQRWNLQKEDERNEQDC